MRKFLFLSIVVLLIIATACGPLPPTPIQTSPPLANPTQILTIQLTSSSMINIAGEQRFLFGANYPWHNYGHDFGENAWGHDGVSAQRNEIEADFDNLSAMGIQVVRWFVFADGAAAPDFAADGSVSGLDDEVYNDLDAALKIAQTRNIRLILVLLDFEWLGQPQEVNGVIKGGHADVITDIAKRDTFYQQALLPLLDQYGQNPYILAWEVMNEPEWAIDDPDIHTDMPLVRIPLDTMQDFISETTEFIHKNAHQWVTLGSASRRWWGLWEHAGLDLCQFHHYNWTETDSPLDFPYADLNTNLPCIVGEFPTAGSNLALDDYYQTILKNGYAGAFPWSLRADDDNSDLIGQASTVQTWADRLTGYIEIPSPTDWISPPPHITRTPTPMPTPTLTPLPP